MALSMVRHETSEWEVVKTKRGGDRRREGAQARAKPATTAADDPETKAFAAFDALHASTDERRGDTSRGSSPRSLPAPETPPRPEQAPASMSKKKDKKKKQQQVKEAPQKTQSAPPSPGLTLQMLEIILGDVAVAYPDNEVAQIQYVADKLLAAYKDISMPFPAQIYTKPMDETLSMFDNILSTNMTVELAKFLRSKSIDALEESFATFSRALFDYSLGPKAQLKSHAGLVVMIVAMARSVPVAIVRCCNAMVAEGSRFAAPDKLPLLVWVFAQAERGATGSLLALWLQAILPQLIGLDQGKGKKGKGKVSQQGYILDPATYATVEDCLRRGLSGGNGAGFSAAVKQAAKDGLTVKCDGTEVTEPIISLTSLDLLRSAIHLHHARVPPRVLSQLQEAYPVLRSIALSSASRSSTHVFLKCSLEFASKTEGGVLGQGDAAVSEAAENVIACLAKDAECFEVWTTKHKGHIRGSCRILQHLLHAPPASFRKLLSSSSNKDLFVKMLKKLQDRHGFLLSQGKGWQGACARGAQEACKAFLGKGSGAISKSGSSISPKNLFLLCFFLGLGVTYLVTKWDDVAFGVREFLKTEQGRAVLEIWERVDKSAKELANSENGQWVLHKVEMATDAALRWFEQAREVSMRLGNAHTSS
ncbi:unnamed protein product [Ostreobium quekettii]|uniref:Uncharacterized protein n=1 Tax=Ostreobium quekettii TaxID=121088 RepID=A0A8S1J5T6_9CHLO|nr:unnamed protein product [Ostreobium quekettii]|eukprot:evm.model.scf_202.5 EVM.evm.TU.scf_202.5   scf_202:45168-50189(-)